MHRSTNHIIRCLLCGLIYWASAEHICPGDDDHEE